MDLECGDLLPGRRHRAQGRPASHPAVGQIKLILPFMGLHGRVLTLLAVLGNSTYFQRNFYIQRV